MFLVFWCAEDIYPEGPADDFTNDTILYCRCFFSCRKTTIPNPPKTIFRSLIRISTTPKECLKLLVVLLWGSFYPVRFISLVIEHIRRAIDRLITNKQRIDESAEFNFNFFWFFIRNFGLLNGKHFLKCKNGQVKETKNYLIDV